MRSAADMQEVGWPDPASVVQRMLSTRNWAANYCQSSIRTSLKIPGVLIGWRFHFIRVREARRSGPSSSADRWPGTSPCRPRSTRSRSASVSPVLGRPASATLALASAAPVSDRCSDRFATRPRDVPAMVVISGID